MSEESGIKGSTSRATTRCTRPQGHTTPKNSAARAGWNSFKVHKQFRNLKSLLNSTGRGFSGVHQMFMKPELRLNPTPVNIKFSESWNKTKTLSFEHQIPFTDLHQMFIFDVHQILMYTRESSMLS